MFVPILLFLVVASRAGASDLPGAHAVCETMRRCLAEAADPGRLSCVQDPLYQPSPCQEEALVTGMRLVLDRNATRAARFFAVSALSNLGVREALPSEELLVQLRRLDRSLQADNATARLAGVLQKCLAAYDAGNVAAASGPCDFFVSEFEPGRVWTNVNYQDVFADEPPLHLAIVGLQNWWNEALYAPAMSLAGFKVTVIQGDALTPGAEMITASSLVAGGIFLPSETLNNLEFLTDTVLFVLENMELDAIVPSDDMGILVLSNLLRRQPPMPSPREWLVDVLKRSLPSLWWQQEAGLPAPSFPPPLLSKLSIHELVAQAGGIEQPDIAILNDSEPTTIAQAFSKLGGGSVFLKQEFSWGCRFVRPVEAVDQVEDVIVDFENDENRVGGLASRRFLQRTHRGDLLVASLYADKGQVVTGYVALAENLPRNVHGSSSVLRTVRNGRVEASCERLVAHLNYTGWLNVDFQQDVLERLYLIDINPRPIANSCLAAHVAHSVGFEPCDVWQDHLRGVATPKRAVWRAQPGVKFANPIYEQRACRMHHPWAWNWVFQDSGMTGWLMLNGVKKCKS